jgi:hypothetical protein
MFPRLDKRTTVFLDEGFRADRPACPSKSHWQSRTRIFNLARGIFPDFAV